MSFILDALRKSETARRRSETPDLFTTMPNPVEAAPARTQWPMLAVGGVGVLSLIAALWLFAQRESSPPMADTGAVPTGPAANADVFETTAPASPSAASPTPASPPPASPTPASPATAGEISAPAPDTSPVEPPVSPPIQPRMSPPASVQGVPPPAPAVTSTRDLPASPQIDTPPAPAAAMPTGDRIVALADLDAAVRNQLPPLKLSMHLWNETPSQRFVILDGQRLKEGDLLGEIVIERITRDGAVLSWRGGRLKIELR